MRVYVEGKWEEREAVRKLQKALRAKGHIITVDWTRHEATDPEYPHAFACEDIYGVQEAEAFIGLFISPNSYQDALVELGVALSNCDYVFIIGHAIDSCIFVYHPAVIQYDTVDDFLSIFPNKGGHICEKDM